MSAHVTPASGFRCRVVVVRIRSERKVVPVVASAVRMASAVIPIVKERRYLPVQIHNSNLIHPIDPINTIINIIPMNPNESE